MPRRGKRSRTSYTHRSIVYAPIDDIASGSTTHRDSPQ